MKKKHKQRKPKIRNYSLYALSLEDGNYYVGMTCQKIEKRYQQHLEGIGSKWTHMHKPLKILETRKLGCITESSAAHSETDMTLEYIGKYGIERVRGGALCYVSTELCMKGYNTLSKVKTTREGHGYNPFAHELKWLMDDC